ncbi:hypothetical protein B9Z55_022623 [Caenorhabditis nigoni]|nr:hypothetical protein B9Z55_022623 [Caenorhabditis nigoni]
MSRFGEAFGNDLTHKNTTPRRKAAGTNCDGNEQKGSNVVSDCDRAFDDEFSPSKIEMPRGFGNDSIISNRNRSEETILIEAPERRNPTFDIRGSVLKPSLIEKAQSPVNNSTTILVAPTASEVISTPFAEKFGTSQPHGSTFYVDKPDMSREPPRHNNSASSRLDKRTPPTFVSQQKKNVQDSLTPELQSRLNGDGAHMMRPWPSSSIGILNNVIASDELPRKRMRPGPVIQAPPPLPFASEPLHNDNTKTPFNDRTSRIAMPVAGSFIHTGHGDLSGDQSLENPSNIDDLYLKNPVKGGPLSSTSNSAQVIASEELLTNGGRSTLTPGIHISHKDPHVEFLGQLSKGEGCERMHTARAKRQERYFNMRLDDSDGDSYDPRDSDDEMTGEYAAEKRVCWGADDANYDRSTSTSLESDVSEVEVDSSDNKEKLKMARTGAVLVDDTVLEVLLKSQLEAYKEKFVFNFNVRTFDNFYIVRDDDMQDIGMQKPQIKQLGEQMLEMSREMGNRSDPKQVYVAGDQSTQNHSAIDEKAFIPNEQIELFEELGEGSFAVVKRGFWTRSNGKRVNVAVKILRDISPNFMDDLRVEASHLLKLQYSSLLRLYGIVHQPAMMVFELCEGGSLLDRLRDNRKPPPTPLKLHFYCIQLAKALQFLQSRHCVHRDVAARNILLTKDEIYIKLADFGFDPSDLAPKKFGWWAPEVFRYRTFSNESDIWAYGVTVWELYTLGEEPWSGHQVYQVILKYRAGERLAKPDRCPHRIYEIMQNCWKRNPGERCKFEKIRDDLLSAFFLDAEDRAEDISFQPGSTIRMRPEPAIQAPPPLSFASGPLNNNTPFNDRTSRIPICTSTPATEIFIHTGHGDLVGDQSLGNPSNIDDLYLKNPVKGVPLSSMSNGVQAIARKELLTNGGRSTLTPAAPTDPALSTIRTPSLDPPDYDDFECALDDGFSPSEIEMPRGFGNNSFIGNGNRSEETTLIRVPERGNPTSNIRGNVLKPIPIEKIETSVNNHSSRPTWVAPTTSGVISMPVPEKFGTSQPRTLSLDLPEYDDFDGAFDEGRSPLRTEMPRDFGNDSIISHGNRSEETISMKSPDRGDSTSDITGNVPIPIEKNQPPATTNSPKSKKGKLGRRPTRGLNNSGKLPKGTRKRVEKPKKPQKATLTSCEKLVMAALGSDSLTLRCINDSVKKMVLPPRVRKHLDTRLNKAIKSLWKKKVVVCDRTDLRGHFGAVEAGHRGFKYEEYADK